MDEWCQCAQFSLFALFAYLLMSRIASSNKMDADRPYHGFDCHFDGYAKYKVFVVFVQGSNVKYF